MIILLKGSHEELWRKNLANHIVCFSHSIFVCFLHLKNLNIYINEFIFAVKKTTRLDYNPKSKINICESILI